MAGRLWTQEELIVTLALYRALPFGRMYKTNPEIIALAATLRRTPSSVAFKLVNFASFDPELRERGVKGMANVGKADREVWDRYADDWGTLAGESERILIRWNGASHSSIEDEEPITDYAGQERQATVRVRIGQNLFRNSVLRDYRFRCCISDLAIPELLNASHILPWSKKPQERLNPRNGLCLNATLDRAFDRGLMTILPTLTVRLGGEIKRASDSPFVQETFLRFEGRQINRPERFPPDPDFLAYHNSEIFRP
ncbi:MAG: HNH endonuclease [Capsulimonadales bacterium]|nr:HNH endonuclease [Capsulimonadales bacterium]